MYVHVEGRGGVGKKDKPNLMQLFMVYTIHTTTVVVYYTIIITVLGVNAGTSL